MEQEGLLQHSQEPRHPSLLWARSIQSIPPSHFLKIHFNFILPFSPGSSKWSFSLRFPHQNPYGYILSLIRSTCPAHHILLDLKSRIIFGEQYRSQISLCNLLHSPVTSSILGPNILLSALFSNILSLLFSLNVSDHVSHPYTTGKIIVLYILISIFFDSKLETKDSLPNDGKHSLISICS